MKPILDPLALDAIERLRRATAHLPEVAEGFDNLGHASFRVRDKPFLIIGQDESGGHLSIKSDRESQRFLVEHRGFRRTPYIGRHGWVSVPQLPPDDWEEIAELAVEGYLLAAPATLANRVRAERA